MYYSIWWCLHIYLYESNKSKYNYLISQTSDSALITCVSGHISYERVPTPTWSPWVFLIPSTTYLSYTRNQVLVADLSIYGSQGVIGVGMGLHMLYAYVHNYQLCIYIYYVNCTQMSNNHTYTHIHMNAYVY